MLGRRLGVAAGRCRGAARVRSGAGPLSLLRRGGVGVGSAPRRRGGPAAASLSLAWLSGTPAPPAAAELAAVPPGAMDEEVMRFVNESARPAQVFSKSFCPFCRRVCQELTAAGVEFDLVELDERGDGGAVQEALRRLTGQRTVPNVFYAKRHVGGCDDTVAALRRGDITA